MKRSIHSSQKTCPGDSQELLDETLSGVAHSAKASKGTSQRISLFLITQWMWPQEAQVRWIWIEKELSDMQREVTAWDRPLWAASLVAQRRGAPVE